MKTPTETNLYIKKREVNQTEHNHYECTDSTTPSSSIQDSTVSMRTANIQKPQEFEYETAMNDQNILNKRNEKLFKPCKNGNCYCFASDSDDFRNSKNKNINRSKQNKPRKSEFQSNDYHQSSSRESDIESFTFVDDTKGQEDISKTNNSFGSKKCDNLQNITANSKTFLRGKAKTGIPIIHIIQEFHENTVISEVRINRPQENVGQEKVGNRKKKTDIKNDNDLDKRVRKFHKMKDSSSEDCFDYTDIFKEKDLLNKNKKNFRYAGQLYQKRIGCESFKHKEYKSPPKKPPRSVSSSSEKCRTNRHVFEESSTINISELKSHKNNRKTFPLDNNSKNIDSQYNHIVSNKDCICRLSENEKLFNKNINFGWIHPDTEIVEMLESNRKLNQLESLQQKPEAQIGWKIPPKLDIDTVDGVSESLPNDSHNFAKNMESKSTPVKSDFTNQTEYSIKEQFKELISNSIRKSKKKSPNSSKVESSSSFKQKAKIGAKVFLINSKQKLVDMVTGRSDKETLSNVTTKTNVAVQTSADNLSDNIKDNFLCNNSTNEINQIASRFSLQSPNDRYVAYTLKENATNEFDFNRTVNSPRSQRSIQRKLSFSPKKLLKNFSYRPTCIDHPTSDNHYYKSYDNNINKDFTLSSINDILLNIRAKLESSDNHAENTFREVYRRENDRKKSFEIKENDDLEKMCRISAQAEVHNNPNPIYSEYEDKLFITGSPSDRSLNDISHYYVDENPNAIYARVKKVVKSSSNVNDKNSPSTAPNLNKNDVLKGSEIYLKNLTSNNNEYELNQSQIRNKAAGDDISIESSELFGDGKEVEYTSLNDFSCSINYMTPEKGPQLESKDEFMEHDVVDGFSSRHIDVNFKLEPDHHLDVLNKNKISLPKSEQKDNKSSPVYKNIKKKFSESLYRSKINFFSSLNKSKNIKKLNNSYRDKNNSTIWDESDLGIYDLYSETPSVSEQLQKTVSLCRKIPYFDSTLEAVEAERLLLYSTLKTENVKSNDYLTIPDNSVNSGKIYIESFKLTVSSDISRDIFFNYFYIAVFSYGSKIKSSNFAEKLENTVIFQNCNIIFDSVNQNSKIKCDIYMLRLRKILNNNSKNNDELISKMETLDVSYETNGDEFLSRFKLQGHFECDPRNFIPYTIEENCNISELDFIMCLHAKNSITIPLSLVAPGTHLKNEVTIQAALEILFPKFEIEGFISIQDIKNKHNWNRLWCKLDYFVLKMWNYPQDCFQKDVVYSFDLCKCLTFPVKLVDRSICARLRTFCLKVLIENDNNCYKNVYFSADNQDHLNFWIDGLNQILGFVNFWMKLGVENIKLNNVF